MKNLLSLVRYFRKLEAEGLLPVFVLTACVQGQVIGSQLLITFFLTPSEIGVIRSLESALAVLILIGSFGAQALSIREVAAHIDKPDQLLILRHIYLLVVFGALMMVMGVFTIHASWQSSVILDLLVLSSGIVLFTNAIRATAGFTQGARIIKDFYLYLIPLSLSALAVQLFVAAYWSVSGWIVGRYLSEGIMLLGMAALLYKLDYSALKQGCISWVQLYRLGCNGVLVNLTLVLKVIADSLPILILTALKIPTEKIGFFGLAVLVVTTTLLPLSVVAQRALPLMVIDDMHRGAVYHHDRYLVKLNMKLALGGSLILTVASLSLYWFVGGDYALAFLLTAILCWSLPLKGLALAYGTVLMARRSYSVSILINSIEVLLVAIAGFFLVSRWGVAGAVCAFTLGSAWSFAAYWFAARR